jgi:hypothetical protein
VSVNGILASSRFSVLVIGDQTRRAGLWPAARRRPRLRREDLRESGHHREPATWWGGGRELRRLRFVARGDEAGSHHRRRLEASAPRISSTLAGHEGSHNVTSRSPRGRTCKVRPLASCRNSNDSADMSDTSDVSDSVTWSSSLEPRAPSLEPRAPSPEPRASNLCTSSPGHEVQELPGFRQRKTNCGRIAEIEPMSRNPKRNHE